MWSLWAGLQRCEYTASAPVSLPHQLSLVIMTSVVLGHTRKAKQWRAAIVYWNYLFSFSYSLSKSLSQTHTHTFPHPTQTSVLCKAAIHAGVVSDNLGGRITVTRGRSLTLYESSFANGILSKMYVSIHIILVWEKGMRIHYSWWHTVNVCCIQNGNVSCNVI